MKKITEETPYLRCKSNFLAGFMQYFTYVDTHEYYRSLITGLFAYTYIYIVKSSQIKWRL